MAPRKRIDPGSWAQVSDEELAERKAEEAAREELAHEEALEIDEALLEGAAAKQERRAERLRDSVGSHHARRPGAAVLICTTDELPGMKIDEVLGEVHGLLVVSRGPFSDAAAGVRMAFGGEVRSYGKLMAQSRAEAVARLKDEAGDLGANAVLTMRFETTAITDGMIEVAAYGTAVVARPAEATR